MSHARAAGLALVALIVASAASASAAESERPMQRASSPAPLNAVSLQLVSLLNNGATFQYERLVAPPLSVATSLGGRLSGGAGYSVVGATFGAEGRYWVLRKWGISRFDGPAMVGPYASARMDGGVVRETSGGEVLGTSMSVAEGVAIGWRLVFAGWIEVTPSAGLGLRTDFAPHGGLAPWTRTELGRFALYAGALF